MMNTVMQVYGLKHEMRLPQSQMLASSPIMVTACGALVALLSFWPIISWADHSFDGRDLERGGRLYAENCAACHGVNLEGQPDWRSPGPDGILPAPPHDVSGHTWHHDTPLLLEYTRLGGQAALNARGVTGFTSGMPAFDDALSEAEAMDILAFIRSTWPDQAQQVQAERTHALETE